MMPLAMDPHCIFLLLTARPVFALSSYAPADPTQTDADLFAPRPAQQKTSQSLRDSYYLCTIIKLTDNINLVLQHVNFYKPVCPKGMQVFLPTGRREEKILSAYVCGRLRLI
jgi:hypothetical protein